jgi:signal transduction histidine kinase
MNDYILRFSLSIITILITCNAFSQNENRRSKIDSLNKEIKSKNGIDKIYPQLDLALLLLNTDNQEAKYLADSALFAANTTNNSKLKMRANYIQGRVNEVFNNQDLSLSNYETALTFADATGDNWNKGEILYRLGTIKAHGSDAINALKYLNASIQACRLSNNFKVLGSSYSSMGTIFRVNGLYDRAIEYIINARLNYEKAGMAEGSAWSAYILGRIYADLKLPQKALGYFQEALEIYIKQASNNGNEEGVAICYEQIGLLKLESGNYQEARNYIDNSLKIYTEIKSDFGISNSHKNLGMIAYATGDFKLAETYLQESLKEKEKINDLLSIPTIFEYLGLCNIGKGNWKEGFKYLQQGLDLAISNNQKKIQLNIYSELFKAYLKINDPVNAIKCQSKQIEIQDSILLGAANIKIEQLQTIYEVDKQNSQIAELERQNEINSLKIKQHTVSQLIMIIGILIALIFSITIYLFYNKIRNKNHELRETNAAKDKFFAIIAHDLRGPAWNLASFLEHLNEMYNELSPEEFKSIILTLHKSAENLSVLLENLLLWAQSQLNKIQINPSKLELTDVLQTTIKGMKQIADDKQIDITLDLRDQIFVLADLNMVQTILRNILSNAIKFTPRGGSILINYGDYNKKNVFFSITDNGVGIEKVALSKIFDLSYTLHTPGTENEKSTGLGLILVKDFIEKNNGTITIESQKGKGTTVRCTLPGAQRD